LQTVIDVNIVDDVKHRQDLSADYALVDKYIKSMPLGSIFCGYEQVVSKATAKLSKYDADLIIVIPLKTGTALETTLANLAGIDLPLITGVILALDEVRHLIFNAEWFDNLKSAIHKIASRYEFIEIVHTTTRPFSKRSMLNGDDIAYFDMRMRQNKALHEAGFKNINVLNVVYQCVREEIRLILKGLNCNYVAWFDADQQVPKDAFQRLLQVIEGETKADLASGWAHDRHYPIAKPTFSALEQYAPCDEVEAKFYQDIQEALKKFGPIFRRHRLAGSDIVNDEITSQPIAPSTIKRLTKPVEISSTGFGCVLMKKAVNDNSTFISVLPGDTNSEDNLFCQKAREYGYKLFVEPTVFCEHLEDLR